MFWTRFLRHLRERGPTGVRLVIGDHRSGLVKAIREVMLGAAYQRCRVHFLRNVFGLINKEAVEMAAATIRTIFVRPAADAVRTRLDTVADITAVLFELHDEWIAFPRRYLPEGSTDRLYPAEHSESAPQYPTPPTQRQLDRLHHEKRRDRGAVVARPSRKPKGSPSGSRDVRGG
ncbi:transposase [Streptomyces coelicoflavus]|uniref:transposase n=1 Tax=Streptomyces coelicoflavus TaxID=285562 RepID=UPI0036AE3994